MIIFFLKFSDLFWWRRDNLLKFVFNSVLGLVKSRVVFLIYRKIAEQTFQSDAPLSIFADIKEQALFGGLVSGEKSLKHFKTGNSSIGSKILLIFLLCLAFSFAANFYINGNLKVSTITRVYAAALGGGMSALSGIILRYSFKSPYLDSSTSAISPAAIAGMSVAIYFHLGIISILLFMFLFSAAAGFVVWRIGFSAGKSIFKTTVTGFMTALIFLSLLYLINFTGGNFLPYTLTGLIGNAANSDINILKHTAAVFAVVYLMCSILGWKLNILSLGDEEARALGVSPFIYRFIFICIVSILSVCCIFSGGVFPLAGAAVTCFTLSFAGHNVSGLLPLTVLSGAAFILFCDSITILAFGCTVPAGTLAMVLSAIYLLSLKDGGKVEH